MAETIRTATVTITATIILTDAFSGYSESDLETEISMGMDEMAVPCIGDLSPIGHLSVTDVVVSGLGDSEVFD